MLASDGGSLATFTVLPWTMADDSILDILGVRKIVSICFCYKFKD